MEHILKEFGQNKSKYENFTVEMKKLVETILDKNSVKKHLIEHRTKTLKSLEDKLKLKGSKYGQINDIPDISGLRIILYYPDQIDMVCNQLQKHFKIIETVDKRRLLESDQFGYLSVHLVVSIEEKRAEQIEWQDYKDFRIEIQVRSILQHAWAMISHALIYKKESEVPKTMKRKLSQLAGLFEIADDYFVGIRDTEKELSTSIEDSILKNKEVEIDLVSLATFLTQKEVVSYLQQLGKNAKIDVSGDSHNECYRDLLYATKISGVNNLSQINTFFTYDPKQVEIYFKKLNGFNRISNYCLAEFLSLLLLKFNSKNVTREQLIASGRSEHETYELIKLLNDH